MILQHDVQDFTQWKVLFDGHQAARAEAGMLKHSVGHLAGAPNTAVIITEWPDAASFQAFAQSATLQEAMKAGGVIGAPIITVVEHG